jgi:SPOR domain
VDFGQYVSGDGSQGAPPTGAAPATGGGGRDWTPIIALGGLVVLGLMLAVGVLIGKGGNSGGETTPAPIVNVGSGAGGTSTTASGGHSVDTANTTFKSDWPAGKNGYTVELGSLPKQGTTADQVDAAKADATSKGASDVGALDSDDYASLPSGNYIVYSGVFTSKADASKALKSIKSKFPDAKVVQVSTKASSGGGGSSGGSGGSLTSSQNTQSDAPVTASDSQLQQLNSNSGSNYEKQSQKLPDEIKTQGKPPPTDNKEPGGGSGGGVVIK